MRPFSFVSLALACGFSVPAGAQTGAQPSLVFTILGGTVTGHQLWTIEKQPLSRLGSSPTEYDTLRLSNAVNSSLVLGVTATYFLSPHVGVHAELSYMGLPIESDCTTVFLHPDISGGQEIRRNGQVCDDIRAQSATGGAITVFGGVTLRATPGRAFSPYLRGNIGVANESRSSIDMVGAFIDSDGILKVRQVIADPSPRRASLMLGAAAGFTAPLSPGYQFRLELRDVIVPLDRLTGPANGLGIGPVVARMYHHFALTIGLDVILERKRGRRY